MKKLYFFVLLSAFLLGFNSVSWGQLFQQNFSSSTTVSDYVNATTPNNGQFNAISTSGAGTVLSINTGGGNNKLRFARTANAGSFSRTTDFSPTPTSLMYRFDLTVSGNTTAQTTAAVFQVGSNFGTANSAESNANSYARLGINFTATDGQFSIRDVTGGTNSDNFSGTQTIIWIMNNSGSSLTYRAPDGSYETIADDRADIWIGTTKSFNDINVQTTTQIISDLKFVFTAGSATIDIDNILINPIPGVPTSNAATDILANSFTANWNTVSGVTGYRIDVSTTSDFSSFVTGYNNLYVSGQSTTSTNITGLDETTTYYYRVRAASQYDVGEFAGANSSSQEATTTSSGSPLINIAPTTLTGFTYIFGEGPSGEQTFTISGSNLTNNISIAASTNYEISTETGIDFNAEDPIILAESGGTVNETTIYVRLKAGLSAGTYNSEEITATSTGAANKTVTASGIVMASEPTIQSSAINFTTVTTTGFTINWTNGNGANRVVLVKSGSAVNSNPVDGTSYTANNAFGSGSQIGTGNFVVYNSSSNSVTVSNLSASTTYHIAVYEFNGSGGTENYLTTSPLTGNQATEAPEEGLQILALDTEYLIDFDNTVSGINNGQFAAPANFATASPAVGALNSNSWGYSPSSSTAASTFGGSVSSGLGQSNGGVSALGVYAFQVSASNYALGIQPTGSGWNTGGNFTLKLQNQTGSEITSLLIKYVVYIFNDQGRSNSFNFSYSSDNSTYLNVDALDLVSTAAADGTPTWKANIRTYLITGISISDNDYYYLRWNGADVGGAGSRDEFALDDIVVVGNPSNTSPSISGTIESAVISGNTQINSTTTVNGTLTFSGNSKLLLGNNNLVIGTSGSISGANSTNYVVTNGTGNLQQNITNGTSKTFHVGPSTSNYNPVTIQLTAGSTTDNYLVRAKNSFTNTPLDVNKVVNVAWEITEQTGGGTDATITLQWNQSQEGSEFNRATGLHIGRFNGDSWVGSSATLGGDNPYTASASGFTSFSEFGVGSEGALPVELTSFTAKANGSNVNINWSTATEIMNYGFEVQRTEVGEQKTEEGWQTIGFVEGHGNSNSVKEYTYTDKNLSSGKYSYRLKQIDTDGTFSFSDVIEVEIEIPKEFALIQNYPNPFNPSTVISYQLAVDSKVSLKIFDILGTEIAELVNSEQSAGSYEIVFDASQLSTGVYFYSIQAGPSTGSGQGFTAVKKMLLMK